jgi:hypothetical protein
MVCILHFSTGKDTGLIIPYDASDYHTWKGHEADLLLGDKPRKLSGPEKAYHVKWVGKPTMNNGQVVDVSTFTEKFEPKLEKIEGDVPSFKVSRGGGFTVTSNGKKYSKGHLDSVAAPLWEKKDKRTH